MEGGKREEKKGKRTDKKKKPPWKRKRKLWENREKNHFLRLNPNLYLYLNHSEVGDATHLFGQLMGGQCL